MPRGLKLGLADGQRWLILPVDGEAAAIVEELGTIMQLSHGDVGRELYVAVCRESDLSDLEASGALVCRLAAPTDRESQVAQMRRIASQVAREAMARGGLLFHGALAEFRGSAFVMAGPGTVGKSTASRRLPPPWRSLCDDMTLVVSDGKGDIWAHPWPTWSRFLYGGQGGSWPVEQAVRPRALFFLDQSPLDRVEPIHGTQVVALTLESVEELSREVLLELADADSARIRVAEALKAARLLASAIPAYSLKISLEGRFWDEIERVLPVDDTTLTGKPQTPGAPSRTVENETIVNRQPPAAGSQRLVCTGTSMNPTLCEPDLLEIEPYGNRRVRRGDVVCFTSPDTGRAVVHRVVAVSPRGIRTRGDNNTADDSGLLKPGDIVGRVTAAHRGSRRRAVPGGWSGSAALGWSRVGQGARKLAGLVPGKIYSFINSFGPFDNVLPRDLRPRLVRFRTRYRVFLKLHMGSQAVGYYDFRHDLWHIRWRFRPFVDEQAIKKVAYLEFSPEARDQGA
jgi:SynChlorMet cassette protein ScmC